MRPMVDWLDHTGQFGHVFRAFVQGVDEQQPARVGQRRAEIGVQAGDLARQLGVLHRYLSFYSDMRIY